LSAKEEDQSRADNPFLEQFVNNGILSLRGSLIRSDTDFSQQKLLSFGSDYRLEQIILYKLPFPLLIRLNASSLLLLHIATSTRFMLLKQTLSASKIELDGNCDWEN